MQRVLVILGVVLICSGMLWPWLAKIPLGRLPGDIRIEREEFSFYFPLMTCVLISGVGSFFLWLFKR